MIKTKSKHKLIHSYLFREDLLVQNGKCANFDASLHSDHQEQLIITRLSQLIGLAKTSNFGVENRVMYSKDSSRNQAYSMLSSHKTFVGQLALNGLFGGVSSFVLHHPGLDLFIGSVARGEYKIGRRRGLRFFKRKQLSAKVEKNAASRSVFDQIRVEHFKQLVSKSGGFVSNYAKIFNSSEVSGGRKLKNKTGTRLKTKLIVSRKFRQRFRRFRRYIRRFENVFITKIKASTLSRSLKFKGTTLPFATRSVLARHRKRRLNKFKRVAKRRRGNQKFGWKAAGGLSARDRIKSFISWGPKKIRKQRSFYVKSLAATLSRKVVARQSLAVKYKANTHLGHEASSGLVALKNLFFTLNGHRLSVYRINAFSFSRYAFNRERLDFARESESKTTFTGAENRIRIHAVRANKLVILKGGAVGAHKKPEKKSKTRAKTAKPFVKKASIKTSRQFLANLERERLTRFRYVAVYIRDLVRIAFCAIYRKKAQFLANFLAFTLSKLPRNRKETQFLRFLRKLVKVFASQRAERLGVRIRFQGRVNRWRRTKFIVSESGNLAFYSYDACFDYGNAQAITRKGTSGIRLWLCYKPYFVSKFKKALISYTRVRTAVWTTRKLYISAKSKERVKGVNKFNKFNKFKKGFSTYKKGGASKSKKNFHKFKK